MKLFQGAGEAFETQGFADCDEAPRKGLLLMVPAKNYWFLEAVTGFSWERDQYLTGIKSDVQVRFANWLEAEFSSAQIGGCFGEYAHVNVTVAIAEDNLQSGRACWNRGKSRGSLIPWKLPKNFIRGQIVSLTIAKISRPFLNWDPAGNALNNPLTNQFVFLWALDQMPLLNYMAWPASGSTNDLQQLATEAPAALNVRLARLNGTELSWNPKSNRPSR